MVDKGAVTRDNVSCNFQRNTEMTKAWRGICRILVTSCNLSNVAKSRVEFTKEFFVARHVVKRGCYKRNFVRNLSGNAINFQVAEKIASSNSALSV